MPKVRLLEHYSGGVPGDVIEIDGGRASVLVLRKVAQLLPEEPKPAALETIAPPVESDEIAVYVAEFRPVDIVALALEQGYKVVEMDDYRELVDAAGRAYSETEFKAYAEANGLRFDTAENFQALLTQAHAPITREQVEAFAAENGLSLLSAEQIEALLQPASAEPTTPALELTPQPAPKDTKPQGAKK